jgi:hypothetical protein
VIAACQVFQRHARAGEAAHSSLDLEGARTTAKARAISWLCYTFEMSQKCRLCGGEFTSVEQCRERFDLCMALEYENPAAYGAVHHISVACYMLQHNAYSAEVWLEARIMLARFIRDGLTPEQVRRQNRSRLDSRHRRWSVTKGAKLPEFDSIVWTRTIADVRLDDPETYCKDVILWAERVLSDTEALIQGRGEA